MLYVGYNTRKLYIRYLFGNILRLGFTLWVKLPFWKLFLFFVFFSHLLFFWISEFYLIYFLYHRFLLLICFIHISVYMSIPISQFIPPSPPTTPPLSPLGVHTFVLYIFVSFLPCKQVHLYHFSRFHIYVLIYDICFSLSDLFHSVWQSLDPSMTLQMTQFRSFLWLSNIPLYVCTTSSWSICLSMGI